MKVGVAVEGPSDRIFLDKVLHKHWKPARFHIRALNGRSSLLRRAPQIVDAFHDLHYRAACLVVDRHDRPCVAAVVEELAEPANTQCREPRKDRYVWLFVPVVEIEAWYLADDKAVASVLPKVAWQAPCDTGSVNAEQVIKGLWQEQYGNVALNKPDLARRMAAKFSPENAINHSASFRYFWDAIRELLSRQ